MNEILPRKWPKIFLGWLKFPPGNGPRGQGNMPWGPGNIPGISINVKLSLRATKHTIINTIEPIHFTFAVLCAYSLPQWAFLHKIDAAWSNRKERARALKLFVCHQ